mmetsp:Transcript_77578/g.179873  ORF Transcript_77578/g.179873 Transcript_77578/m.179873 type:complete len:449 (-) Transcript_77578:72-1418(-)|eukprot:CAMPEP_0171079290 /NCGR_PEP_ID=MMETSP0766_2-20121228/15165_1 /TAXON_ID=439317 /ORGANISM="Gambierdiscus australes, Strain CAWD 149" /LENGTH=448 /DNA_ID=CAMNT_0011536471 /DNA_START=40 /DNA_END=1386 /DNA_ORIENTATION=+
MDSTLRRLPLLFHTILALSLPLAIRGLDDRSCAKPSGRSGGVAFVQMDKRRFGMMELDGSNRTQREWLLRLVAIAADQEEVLETAIPAALKGVENNNKAWCVLPIMALVAIAAMNMLPAAQPRVAGKLPWFAVFEVILALMMFFTASSCIIFLNHHILRELDFPFPIFVSNMGNLALMLLTRILVWSRLCPLAHTTLPPDVLKRAVIPLSLCGSAALICGNQTYLYLSLPLIQILKTVTLVLTMLLGFLVGAEQFSFLTVSAVMTIVIGLTISVAPGADPSKTLALGLGFALCGSCVEAGRVVFLQLSVEKLRFLDALYWCSPMMAGLSGLLSLVSEPEAWGRLPHTDGRLALCLSASAVAGGVVSFSTFWAMKFMSSLTMKVVMNARNVAVMLLSVLLLGQPCSPLQHLGFAVALAGLGLYENAKRTVAEQAAKADDAGPKVCLAEG